MYYLRFQFLAKFICCTLLLFVSSSSFAKQQVVPPNPEREAAIKLLEAGKNAEAVQAFRHYLSNPQNSKDAEVWLYFGVAQYRNNELEAAKDTLKKAVKLNPGSDIAHSKYAAVLYDLRKFNDAEKESGQAVKLNPNNSEAVYLQGLVFYGKGECAKAIANADAIMKLNPQFAQSYMLKAQALIGFVMAKGGGEQKEFPVSWKKAFFESASLIEKYIELKPSGIDTEFWHERLNALRYYAGDKSSLGCISSITDPGVVGPQILYKEKARYTDEARNYGIHGTIRIKAIFDADGRVKHVLAVTFLPGGLTNEAIKAAQKIQFHYQ